MWIKGQTPQFRGIKRILLIQLGDIGDVVLSLPCIRALKEAFPAAQVVAAVRAKARELIENCPWAHDVISVDQPRLRPWAMLCYQTNFIQRLRRFDFDLVFDLRAGTRGAFMTLLSGAGLRIGYHSAKEPLWRNLAFTHLKPFIPDPQRHQALHYQNLLTQCGIKFSSPHPEIEVTDESTRHAALLLRQHQVAIDKPLVALHPFSLWSYKEWPLEKVGQLAQRLSAQYALTIVLIGSAAERQRAQAIVDQCNGPGHVRAVNLAGETSLLALAAIVKQCRLLIGMDSAGGHIAAAVGTPCVIVFGPGRPGVWAPLGDQHRIVSKELACIHCGLKGCEGNNLSRCLEQLSVSEVFAVIREQLGPADTFN